MGRTEFAYDVEVSDVADLAALHTAFADGRYGEALAVADAELSGEAVPPSRRGEIHRVALQAAFHLGDGDGARRHGFAALRIAIDHGTGADQARAHNHLAVVFGAEGLFDEALDHLWKAVHLREADGDEVDGPTLNNLGNVYVQLGRHDEAIALYDRAHRRASADGDEANAAVALANVGRTHALAGRSALAIPALDTALDTFERLRRHDDVAVTLAKLGVAHGRAGAHARAERSFERALALHALGHAHRFEPETRHWYGAWALENGDLATALEQLGAAAAAPGDRGRSGVLEPLSRALEAAGRTEQALATLRRYVEVQADRRSAAAEAVARVRLLELEFGVHGEQEVARLHAVELERRNAELRSRAERLEELSVTDPLTGLPNRRELDHRLHEEVERSRRYDHELVMALLDLDRFKEINDGYSHDVGDRVLMRVARILREQLRSVDVAARWGGEEFALLFPETSLAVVQPIVERLRATLANDDWSRIAPGLRVTASIGVASLAEADAPGGEGAAALLRLADRRLYLAKNAGRDQAVAAD